MTALVEILPVVWPLFAPSDNAIRSTPMLLCISLLKPNPHRNAIRRDG